MKTICTLITGKLMLQALLLLLVSTSTLAQSGADFDFTSNSLVSGTDRQSGSIYLFTNVRHGVDCRVTITSISPNTSIDRLDDNSNGAGFPEAFQPRIQVNGRTRGYGEFAFRFVKAGTNTDTIMNEIPVSSIDVDGSNAGPDSLLEFDEYFLPSSYLIDFDMLAGQLSFNFLLGSILGRHKAAIEYTGIDTTGRSVMFTVVYPHTSTFSVRIGVDNTMGHSVTRQRSVYFKRFLYPHSYLPVKDLRSFGGVSRDNSVKLNWSMNRGHNIVTADVERSLNGTQFNRIGSVSVAAEINSVYNENNFAGNAYYRLKLTDVSGKVSYSEVLFVKNAGATPNSFKVFPSVVTDYTTVNFTAAKSGSATVTIADQNGRMVKNQVVSVQQGFNSTVVNGLDRLPAGQYVAVLNGAGYSYTQKILIAK